eukprot:2278173-Prymnesium_polylepis.1
MRRACSAEIRVATLPPSLQKSATLWLLLEITCRMVPSPLFAQPSAENAAPTGRSSNVRRHMSR